MCAEHPILVVDDDRNTREAMMGLLEARGYAVVAAADGAEGLAKLHAGLRPSLILLDLMMPEKNGFQFRVEQVLNPEYAEIPVVVCSGNADVKFSGALLGAVAHLPKPIDVDQLMTVVQAHCAAD